MALVSDVVVIFWRSIVILNVNGQFLVCANIAFSEGYVYFVVHSFPPKNGLSKLKHVVQCVHEVIQCMFVNSKCI